MNNFAPEYSTKEKFLLFAKHLAWALPLFIVGNYWFLPWFKSYAENAHCYNYGSFTGIHVIYYSVFVVIPLLSALILFLITGLRSIKVLRLGQSPLPNEKVFKPTKYTYGLRAKIGPIIFLVVLVFLLGLSVWGVFWANKFIDNAGTRSLPICISSR